MPLVDLTEAAAVLAAIAEFDAMGREAFLQKYGFGPAREYFLIHQGTSYDSKAIVGAAHGFQHPTQGPLSASSFSGGESTVATKLRSLGFEVTAADQPDDSPPMSPFMVGRLYTRQRVQDLLGVPAPQQGGNWDTGYTRYKDEWFIFCNIGVPGRTGHDYDNHFKGDDLVWSAKTGSSVANPSIQAIIAPDTRVSVFYRNSERAPFIFAGRATAHDVVDSVPVRLVWKFLSPDEPHPERSPTEVIPGLLYAEGAVKSVLVNAYERNPAAREACLAHYGCSCQVCELDMSTVYGERGKGFIHVHHLKPLAAAGGSHEIDPITDLKPVCPNCHAMLHLGKAVMEIEDLKAIVLGIRASGGGLSCS